MAKFSVVIAVYNKESYIRKTLQSVLDQTFEDFEVIIYNDGSTDNSEVEILKFKDNRIRYYKGDNLGAAAARNFCIHKAKGTYIALLDADDVWNPIYLEEQNNSILKYNDYKVFATRTASLINGKTKKRIYSVDMKNGERYILNYFSSSLINSILHSSSTVIHKSIFDVIGFYNPQIKSGQDTDLYVRIGINYDIVFYNKSLVTYHVIKDSLFRSSKSVSDKPNFDQYEREEKTNQKLKKFLDLNRYSLCLLAKLDDDKESFEYFKDKIDFKNLNSKQKFLIKQNKYTLVLLKNIQKIVERYLFKISSFT
ncbi:MAG: glycosyltransferase family 2 protein [Patiriisocius sp.]|uniref:glycosyltransferase family 2 protein n=1 Tax=Patiriisocius sp. TaxID=2822396 RepID=UPI003EF59B37